LHGQLLRRPFVKELAHPLVEVRPGDDLIPAGHLHELQTAAALVLLAQRGERHLNVFLRFGIEQFSDRFGRQRLR
jgi:hypothetical protein